MATKKNFEKSIGEINEIITKFEDNEIPLDESIKLYKKAITLISDCKKQLDNAKLEVETLIQGDIVNE
ncbi:MAG: exodeoxyribonuclease VII small subunit [Oscillospiraceae bacterium]